MEKELNKVVSVNDLDQNVPTRTITTTTASKDHPLEDGYLVSSPSCHIPSLDPFAPDVMKIFHRRNYKNVSYFKSTMNAYRFH